jgi:ammonium transporter, Amt family
LLQYAAVGLEEYSKWFGSFSFCATSLAVVAGALAERIQLRVHILASIFFVTVTYPFIVHWAWGNGWASPFRSSLREELLAGCGVVDFAGCGVVHMTGGLVALIMSKMAQPRDGRFTVMFDYPMYSSIFQSLGALLMWVGWYGMIAVRAQSVESDENWGNVLMRAMSTTSVSGAAACVTSVLIGNFLNGSISTQLANNGALSGLVAVSASCATCSMEGAFVIGKRIVILS